LLSSLVQPENRDIIALKKSPSQAPWGDKKINDYFYISIIVWYNLHSYIEYYFTNEENIYESSN